MGTHPEVISLLEASLADQKDLARVAPDRESLYRQRFDAIEATIHHLEILRHNRSRINQRLAYGLAGISGLALLAAFGFEVARQQRDRRRLRRLGDALEDLSVGRSNIVIGDARRDTIGRIAGMIEEASRTFARQRERLDALTDLERWQDAARRQAHELRTPLTAARLELDRLQGSAGADPADMSSVTRIASTVAEDLLRLETMVSGFASFARLAKPSPGPLDLPAFVADFATTFSDAWPNIVFDVEDKPQELMVRADRGLIRHVLVNLCENSAQAAHNNPCSIRFSFTRSVFGEPVIEVGDDGPGVTDKIASRLFDPYVSGHEWGENLGLGLPIARKVMLDHGGDLELASTSPSGTTFRITFPVTEAQGQ